MKIEIPCLFELDPVTQEATGTVVPFCSVECRTEAKGTLGFPAAAEGTCRLADFGYVPHCEECGEEIQAAKVLCHGHPN